MRNTARVFAVAVGLAVLFNLATINAFAGGVNFPGGSVRWGHGHGGVNFPGGGVRWAPGSGGVKFPGGHVKWCAGCRGGVNVKVPGTNLKIRW